MNIEKIYKDEFASLVKDWWLYNGLSEEERELFFENRLNQIKKLINKHTDTENNPPETEEQNSIEKWDILLLKFAQKMLLGTISLLIVELFDSDLTCDASKQADVVYENKTGTLYYNSGIHPAACFRLILNDLKKSEIKICKINPLRKKVTEGIIPSIAFLAKTIRKNGAVFQNEKIACIKLKNAIQSNTSFNVFNHTFNTRILIFGIENNRLVNCPYTKKTFDLLTTFSPTIS